MAVLKMPVVLKTSASYPVAVLKLPVVLESSALQPMAVLPWPVSPGSALTPSAVFARLESQICGHCALARCEGTSHATASASALRRKPIRKGERFIDVLTGRVVDLRVHR